MLVYQNSADNSKTTVTEQTTGLTASLTTKGTTEAVKLIREEEVTKLLQRHIFTHIVEPFLNCEFDYRVIRQDDDFATELSVNKFQKDRVVPVMTEQTVIKVLLYDKSTHLSDEHPQMFEWWCWNYLETSLAKIVTIKTLKELDDFNRKQGCSPKRHYYCGCD